MKKALVLFVTLFALTLAGRAHALAPQFHYVAPGWVVVPGPTGSPGPVDLSDVWHAKGFTESGLGYAYVDGPVAGSTYWEHFNPEGDSYQAFFGAYVIPSGFPYAADWKNPDGSAKTTMTAADVQKSANELIGLGNVDQFAWLSFYSAPYGGPTASAATGSPIITPDVDGFWRVTFFVNTTSDLGAVTSLIGAPVPPAPWVPPFSLYAADVDPFASIVVEASVLIKYDVPTGTLLAKYGSATHYTVDGHPKNTSFRTIVQIGRMQEQLTFQ